MRRNVLVATISKALLANTKSGKSQVSQVVHDGGGASVLDNIKNMMNIEHSTALAAAVLPGSPEHPATSHVSWSEHDMILGRHDELDNP